MLVVVELVDESVDVVVGAVPDDVLVDEVAEVLAADVAEVPVLLDCIV